MCCFVNALLVVQAFGGGDPTKHVHMLDNPDMMKKPPCNVYYIFQTQRVKEILPPSLPSQLLNNTMSRLLYT